MSPIPHQRLAPLRDGRWIAYLACGPADGLLVFYLHGAIGSPQQVCPELEAVVDELGVRYVMVSRPGFGESDPLPGRTLTGFAAYLAELADQFGSQRFAVVGVSAGGPYALACAHELPTAFRRRPSSARCRAQERTRPPAPRCRCVRGCGRCGAGRVQAHPQATPCSASRERIRGSSRA